MSAFDEPHDRWEPAPVEIVPVPGPDRVYDADPKPPLPCRPLGFRLTRPEIEPLLWNGDYS